MQEAIDMEAAKSAVLPPLQSVVELTSAAAPPQRGAQPVTATAASTSAGGRRLFFPNSTCVLVKVVCSKTRHTVAYIVRGVDIGGVPHQIS